MQTAAAANDSKSKSYLSLVGGKNQKEEQDLDPIIDYNLGVENRKLNVRLMNFLRRTKILSILYLLSSCFSIILIAQFAAYTYKPEFFQTMYWGIINTSIRICLVLHMIMEVVVSPNILSHIFEVSFLLDLFLTVPFFSIFIYSGQPPDVTVYVTHITFTNLVAVFKLKILSELLENEVVKQIVNIIIVIWSLIFAMAGTFMYLYNITGDLNNGSNKAYTDSFGLYEFIFFIMETCSTVGYENPFFVNPVLRVTIVVFIVTAIVIIPVKSSELIGILSNKSVYSRINYKKVENTDYVVLCGSLGMNAVNNFLIEFFHPDHGGNQKHCVILSPLRPDNDMENLLREQKYEKNLIYIQGNPLDEISLKRAQADSAKAVLIMCNKHATKPDEEDSKTIMLAISINKYLDGHPNSDTKIYFQLMRSDSKSHYQFPTANKQDKNEQMICLEELKLSLFAKSCICPGLIALVTNLINSTDIESDESIEKWLEEYWHGIGFEIYKTQLSKVFKGKTFSEAASIIYRKFNAILFGIEVSNGRNGNTICINPGASFSIKDGNVGYIIAEDKDVADQIRNSDLEERAVQVEENITVQKMLLKTMGDFLEKDLSLAASKVALGKSDYTMYINTNCILSKSRIDISDVTKETMNGNILATNHIIVSGLVQNIYHFVVPLRSKYLNRIPPIVILNEEKPDSKTWTQISTFPEIYYVKGSALNEKDLYRANIMKASRFVILANRFEFSNEAENDDSNVK